MRLPEYDGLIKLLEKGIGIHHSGMIPILREIVETVLKSTQFELPELAEKGVKKVIINKETVKEKAKPMLVYTQEKNAKANEKVQS